MKNSTIALSLGIILLTAPIIGHSKMYKWVDEQGVTHYSQTPPQQGPVETIKPAPEPSADPAQSKSRLNKQVEAFNERRKNKQEAQQKEDQTTAEQKERDTFCEQVRTNLASAKNNQRIAERTDDGQLVQLSEEQRQAKIKKYEDQLQKFCQ